MAAGQRDLKKESFWRRVVAKQSGSGMSVRTWCRRQHVAAGSFYWWRRELGRRDAEQIEFVPVRVAENDSTDCGSKHSSEHAGTIEIVLGGGRCLRISGLVDRQMIADVVAILEGRAC